MSGWTDEKIEELKKLWAEGLTTGEIGRRLDFSKNAVVGKAHRLKLEARPSPIKRSKEKNDDQMELALEKVDSKLEKEVAKEIVKEVEKEVKPVKKKIEKVKAPVKKKEASIADLTSTSCRWPIGDPKEEGFHFCGKETFNGKPYCLEHCAQAYVGLNKKNS